jgi:nitronate monooxygenase
MSSILRTHLCKLLGIEAPIFAAPMGFLTGPDLAAAVSNADGLGIMSFSANPPPVLRDEILRLRSLTIKPVGVNVLLSGLHLPFSVDELVNVCIEERVPVLSTN